MLRDEKTFLPFYYLWNNLALKKAKLQEKLILTYQGQPFCLLSPIKHIYFFNTHLLYEWVVSVLLFELPLFPFHLCIRTRLASVFSFVHLIYFIHLIEEKTYEVDSDRESSNVQYHRAVTQQVLVQPFNKQIKWDTTILHLPACKYDDAIWFTLLLLPSFRTIQKILVAPSFWNWKMVLKLFLLTSISQLKWARLVVPRIHMNSEWTM